VNVALIAGTLLAAPFIMFQVWRFIAPGLYANEKKLAIPFVLLTTAGVQHDVFPSRDPQRRGTVWLKTTPAPCCAMTRRIWIRKRGLAELNHRAKRPRLLDGAQSTGTL